MPAEIEQKFEDGRVAFQNADFDGAEKIFRDVIATESSSEIRNQARIYLGSVLCTQFVPGLSTPENFNWLERAEEQYFEVLDSVPFASTEQTETAIRGLGAIVVFRRPTPNGPEV